MELKQAMEVATEDIDVRPGFVGDVMAGARRRHTRKLVTITAVVALIAGVTAGVVLTSGAEEYTTGDLRLVAATTGDRAENAAFLTSVVQIWEATPSAGVSDSAQKPRVLWAGTTPGGPDAAVVVQPVRLEGVPDPKTLVGVVAGGAVVDREIVYAGNQEQGLYRFGDDRSINLVLTLGQTVYWSVDPVRAADNRLSRQWQQQSGDAVVVVRAAPERKPVFVRSTTKPEPSDFTREALHARPDPLQGKAFIPHPGLGWTEQVWATDDHDQHDYSKSMMSHQDVQRQALLDYVPSNENWSRWQVRAWLPDGRFASVFEANGEVYAALYRDGKFDTALYAGPAVKGQTLPVRVKLPDDMGTLVADFDRWLGPDRRRDAWIAPAGTVEVRVEMADGNVVQTPL